MDFGLGEDIDALRETVRKFAQEEIAPKSAEVDRSNDFPMELWEMMGNLGLHGITISEEFGGVDMGYLAHCVAVEEISRANAAIGMSYGAHSNLCINQIYRWGNEQQKSKYLPKLISGEHIGSLAMSEPSAGSDVVSMKLKAEKRNDYYLLNGSKMWITNGPDADTLVVYAKTDISAGPKGITAFLIEKGMEGFSTGKKLDKLGMRGSNTSELIFENCEVPYENVLGEEGKGVNVLMSGLDYERVVLAAGPVGIMAGAMDVVVPYIHEREQFGKQIVEFQAVQMKLAEMAMKVEASRLLIHRAAHNAQEGFPSIFESSVGKCFSNETAREVVVSAMQLMGGYGFNKEYGMERKYRDVWGWGIAGGTIDIQKINIASAMVGKRFNQRK